MPRLIPVSWLAAAALLWFGAPIPRAEAVVILTGDGSGNTTAPPDNPGWADMAQYGNASAVYLGDGWMITAAHVADSVGNVPVRFTDGRVFNVVAGSNQPIFNPNSLLVSNPQITSATADLTMFRLTSDPGLPAAPIATTSPGGGSSLMMIGAGRDRLPNMIGWSVSSSSVWTQTPLPFANARGFAVDPNSSHMRWGMNRAGAGGTSITNSPDLTTATATFSTAFNSSGVPYMAQAVAGDSGGGVFEFVNGSWQLVGLMDAILPNLANQPVNTAVFGNDQTASADLSIYHDEIESIITQSAPLLGATALSQASLSQTSLSQTSLWQNPANRFDVARSGTVNAHDLLLLINSLQNGGVRSLSGAPTASDLLLDVNGDGMFNLLDLSQLINALANNTANPAPLGMATATQAPEPSTGVLASLGVLLVALVRGLMIARRTR